MHSQSPCATLHCPCSTSSLTACPSVILTLPDHKHRLAVLPTQELLTQTVMSGTTFVQCSTKDMLALFESSDAALLATKLRRALQSSGIAAALQQQALAHTQHYSVLVQQLKRS